MSSGIFVLVGEDLLALRESPYDSEDLLQSLVAKYPQLLAGDDGTGAARWLLVKRELGVPSAEAGGNRWWLDHLFIDQRAVPTLVEVKRSDDTRIRREVVGQMLDYAANGLVYWPTERLRSEFEARCAAERQEPSAVLRDSLGDELDPDQFWGSVEQNLRSGKVRLVFVADEIPAELRRVIEFLNEQMNPAEVFGIEIRRYVGDGQVTTLVPRVVGQTEQARIQKLGNARSPSIDVDWDHYEQALPDAQLAIVREVYQRMERAIAHRGLTWQPRLKPNYMAFYRPGPYNCCGINLRKTGPIEFWIKLPAPLEDLASGDPIPDPFPELGSRWDAHNRQMTWTLPSIDRTPELAPAIELASRYQPATGPMINPTESAVGSPDVAGS